MYTVVKEKRDSYSLVWAVRGDFFPKSKVWKGEISSFIVEETWQQLPQSNDQGSKVSNHNDNVLWHDKNVTLPL